MNQKLIFGILWILLGTIFCQAQIAKKSVLGMWNLEITVPPQPMATNAITFKGSETEGEFVDKMFGRNHRNWT